MFDPQHDRAVVVARKQPVEQRRARAADVERAGRRGSEANPHESYLRPSARRIDFSGTAAMLIGAHVSASGGLASAIGRGLERGCRAIQIFNQSPRAWRPNNYDDED